MMALAHLHRNNKSGASTSTNGNQSLVLNRYAGQTIVPTDAVVPDVVRRARVAMAEKIIRPNCSLPARSFHDLIMAAPLNDDLMTFTPQKTYTRRLDSSTKVHCVDLRAKQTHAPVVVRLGSAVEPLRIVSPISNFATDQSDEKAYKEGLMTRRDILEQLADPRVKNKIEYNLSLSARVQRPFSEDVFAYAHTIDRLSLEAFVRSADDPVAGWDDVAMHHKLTDYKPLLGVAITDDERKLGITHIGPQNHPWKDGYEIGRNGISYLNMGANFYPDDLAPSSRRAGKKIYAFKTAIYRLNDQGEEVPAHWTDLVPDAPFTPATFQPICIMVEGAVTRVETKKGAAFGPTFECSKIVIVPSVAAPVLDGSAITPISQQEVDAMFETLKQNMGLLPASGDGHGAPLGIHEITNANQTSEPDAKRTCPSGSDDDTGTVARTDEATIDIAPVAKDANTPSTSDLASDPLLAAPSSEVGSKKRARTAEDEAEDAAALAAMAQSLDE